MPSPLAVVREIANEVDRAQTLFDSVPHPHYYLGVIEEEFEEFRQEVFKLNIAKGRDTRPQMRKELIQLAAMAVRAILDCNLED